MSSSENSRGRRTDRVVLLRGARAGRGDGAVLRRVPPEAALRHGHQRGGSGAAVGGQREDRGGYHPNTLTPSLRLLRGLGSPSQ